jgi:hypothetical protein
MRIDHIVVHIDKDAEKFDALSSAINDQGFPFNPNAGKRSLEYRVSNINIGNEYIELVGLCVECAFVDAAVDTPLQNGQRGVFCNLLGS